MTNSTTDQRGELELFKDIQTAEKVANGLRYGILEKEFEAFQVAKEKFMKFMKNNAHQAGQQFPHREQAGKPMVLSCTLRVGFKQADGDKEMATEELEITSFFRTEEQKKVLDASTFVELEDAENLGMIHCGDTNEVSGWDDVFKAFGFLYNTNLAQSKNIFANNSSEEILSAKRWWTNNAVSDPKLALEVKLKEIEDLKEERKAAINDA